MCRWRLCSSFLGCTDSNANNYNADATEDDGSFRYSRLTIMQTTTVQMQLQMMVLVLMMFLDVQTILQIIIMQMQL